MTQLLKVIGRLVPEDQGQDLVEYGLLAALIAIVAIVGVTTVGNTIFTVFWSGIGQAL
jgi:Flp pilus assembly pilin Flp